MSTMLVQGGLRPQFLDDTATTYLLKGTTDIEAQINDMPDEK